VSNLVAVARFARHSREYVVILRPGKRDVIAQTMYFASEVRRDEEYQTDLTGVTAKELELANRLVKALAGPFEPERYRDTYREQLEAIIAAKVEGRDPAKRASRAVRTGCQHHRGASKELGAALKKPPRSTKQASKTSNKKQPQTAKGTKAARTGG
jgi:DNA end-binding protein Ku